jgi:hypothetical protein
MEQELIEKRRLARKLSDYKWRDSHREQYNAYVASQMKIYYAKNREGICKKAREYTLVKKEFQRFLNILL